MYPCFEDSFDTSFENSFDNGPLPLEYQPYYRGNYNRMDSERDLTRRKNGDFIIRNRTGAKDVQKYPCALSINSMGRVLHAKIGISDGYFYMEGRSKFESIVEMVDYYKRNGIGNVIKDFHGELN